MSKKNFNPIANFINEVEAEETSGFDFEDENTKPLVTTTKEEEKSEKLPEQEETETEENPETSAVKSEPKQPTLGDDDGFDAALKKCKSQSEERLIGNLSEKNPVFKYANANEPITDKDVTFEDLRKKYETDFPELEAKSSVSWSVTYGKTTQSISKPNEEKVFAVKEKIEKSDKFIADLKKAKKDIDKNPECIVKPYVAAQKKGDVLFSSSYKGFFFSADEAIKSPKAISYVPSRNGQVYEIRKNQIGIFQSPARVIGEFPDLKPSFSIKLPKIPMFLLFQIISFFKMISEKKEVEALVHIVFNTETQKYNVKIPKQKITKCSVDALVEEYPENIIHVMDIHSHNTMDAKFSVTDDNDEKATRLYGVIGKLDKEIPDMELRASNGGKFINLTFSEVFDVDATYPESWADEINHDMAEAVCEIESGENGNEIFN